MLETLAAKEATEQAPEVLVIWLILVIQSTNVVHVGYKLRGQTPVWFGYLDRLLPLENKPIPPAIRETKHPKVKREVFRCFKIGFVRR